MWAPDVYDGAPTPVTGFMATGVKAAAFAALVRVLMEAFPSAIATSGSRSSPGSPSRRWCVGNLVALAQRSLKRMLAYSSIAHAGYLLVAVWPGTPAGAGAVLLYLLAYSLTTLASFGFLAVARPRRRARRDATTTSPGSAPARPWIALRPQRLHALAAGLPGHVRLHRQVVHPRRRGRRRTTMLLAGDPGAHQRGVARATTCR